jgi:hypothetical protein
MHSVPYLENDGLRATTKDGLTLVRYQKPLVDPALSAYRSVIYKGTELVSFTPPKALPFEDFKAKYPIEQVRVEEFMDGTMVYAYFFDGSWRLGTRSVLDADTTYRCGTTLLKTPAPTLRAAFLAKVGPQFFDHLSATRTYVFSLLTPLTFNVVKGDALYLTAVYEIAQDKATLLRPEEYGALPPGAQLPPRHGFTDYATVVECADEVPWTCKGFMLHAGGERTKVLSSAFKKVAELLDNEPNINRCLLKLMREHRDHLFLDVYPEYRPNARQLQVSVKSYTNALYSAYLDCFCAKTRPLRDYAQKNQLWQLHQLYLTKLRPAGKRVNKQEVVQYVAGLSTPVLAGALNL